MHRQPAKTTANEKPITTKRPAQDENRRKMAIKGAIQRKSAPTMLRPQWHAKLPSQCGPFLSREAESRKPCCAVIFMPVQPKEPARIAPISAAPGSGPSVRRKKIWVDIDRLWSTLVDKSRPLAQIREDFGPVGHVRQTTAMSGSHMQSVRPKARSSRTGLTG